MTTELLIGGVAGVVVIVFLALVYTAGKYRHAQQDGVVDLNDYRSTRLQLIAAEAVDEQTEQITESDRTPGYGDSG